MKALDQYVRVVTSWTGGLLTCAALGVTTSVWAQGTGASSTPPREEWVRIFEKNAATGDRNQAKAERKAWSEEMLDAFDDWLIRRGVEESKRLDEEKRLREQTEQILTEAKLMNEVVGLYSSDDAVTRESLVQRIRQQPRLTSDEDLAEFARDFIAGKPLDRAYMPAILRWLARQRTALHSIK